MHLSSWVPGLPPAISSLSLYSDPFNSSSVPLSYSQSSDDSDTHSSSGGGSQPSRPPGHGEQREFDSHYERYTHSDDPPFVPGRANPNFQRGFIVAPEVADHLSTPEYAYPGGLYPSPQEIDPSPDVDVHATELGGLYSFQNTQHQGAFSGFELDSGSGFDDLRTDDEDGWREQRGPAGRDIRPMQGSTSPASGFRNARPAGRNAPTTVYPSALQVPTHLPDAGGYLRQQLNLSPNQQVNLLSLPDPPIGQRPSQALPVLVKLAIYGSPRKMLTLQEIYQAIEDRFEWYRMNRNEKAWKNSIRHNLSLNQVFRNVARPITEPGKGSYWVLDVSNGEGYKRERKRRPKSGRAASNSGDDDDSCEDSDPSPSPSFENGAIDPALISEGSSRLRRTTSSAKRASPYPGSGSSSRRSPAAAPSSASSSSTVRPGSPSTPMMYQRIDPPPSQPRFGQPSLTVGSSHLVQNIFDPPLLTQSYPRIPFANRSFPSEPVMLPTMLPSRPSTVPPMQLLSQPTEYRAGSFPPPSYGNALQPQAFPPSQYPNQFGPSYPGPESYPSVTFNSQQLDPKDKSHGF